MKIYVFFFKLYIFYQNVKIYSFDNVIRRIFFQLTVANIPGLSELGKAHEYANHCRRTHKELKEALADASKYNSRERLFGMPITSVRSFLYP